MPRLRQIQSGTGVRDLFGIERAQRIGNAGGTAIGNVIACERDRIEACVRERCEMLGRSRGRRYIAFQFFDGRRVSDFQMSDRKIGFAQRWRNAREPVIGVRFIENQVARKRQLNHRWSTRRLCDGLSASHAASRPSSR